MLFIAELVLDYGGLVFGQIIARFDSNLKSRSDDYTVLFTLITVAWFIFILLGFLYLWFVYIEGLSNNIWRTRGMLSMIPIDVVIQNEKMKHLFLNGGLAKGV